MRVFVRQLKSRRWFNSTFQMNMKFSFRQSFYKIIKFHKLLSNPTQMCILKRVFVFQPVTKNAVEAGVTEQDCPCEHQPGDGKQVAQNIKRNRNSLVVDQVIGPCADAGVCQIAKHTQVRSKK